MSTALVNALAGAVRETAWPLTGATSDYDPLLDRIGNARFVLIGEASHGTHEFYSERARITQRLIRENGFNAVAVEADWPDAYRVNDYVRGAGDAKNEGDALAGFQRFPTWMWRNLDVLDFVAWLRSHNRALPPTAKVGFYGLDLYSLCTSIEGVLRYLDKVDPAAARRARARYACFDHFGEDTQAYSYAAGFGLTESCEGEVVNVLVEILRRAADYASRDGRVAADDFFYAAQNARVVRNAEAYYRSMFLSRISSWNLRDRHMMETLQALDEHLKQQYGSAKIVVWAHNSHLGDARATQLGRAGEWNVGQLVRERYAADSVLIGFSTYEGTVTAASGWDGPAERKRVRPALSGSYESLFHDVAMPRFSLIFHPGDETTTSLAEPRLERAIGVIYRPEMERRSHYFEATMPDQFDAVLHFDDTRAVEPLERTPKWETGEASETFPYGV